MTMAAALDRVEQIQSTFERLGMRAPAAAQMRAVATTSFDRVLASHQPAIGAMAPGAAGAADGGDVAAAALKYVGVPYVFSGEDASGMDCSGLVQRAFADLGIAVPRVVQDQADIGVEVPSLAQARPGDLIVTRDESHIAIYLGDGKLVHAPRPGTNVRVADVYLSEAEIGTIRRIVPESSSTDAAASLANAARAQLLSGPGR